VEVPREVLVDRKDRGKLYQEVLSHRIYDTFANTMGRSPVDGYRRSTFSLTYLCFEFIKDHRLREASNSLLFEGEERRGVTVCFTRSNGETNHPSQRPRPLSQSIGRKTKINGGKAIKID
jgi:hypothetical protein